MKKINKVLKKRNLKHASPEDIEALNKNVFLKRSLFVLGIFIFVFVCLLIKIGYIQFILGDKYSTEAYKQQTISQVISPKRGIIYDSTGKVLARSTIVYTISVNPGKVVYADNTAVPNDILADKFSELFELDRKKVIEDLESTSSVVTIIKKVDTEKSNNLKAWMTENKITAGINIDEDTKRTYPYKTLASHLIGFCGSDNQGLEGLEAEWDDVLRGTSGRIVTTTDVNENTISDESEQYIPAENGSHIYLTIDAEIQSTAEKYLKQAIKENKADSGTVIIMDPTDGDILSLANYPNYNLNTPFVPNTSELKKKWDTLSNEEQAKETYAMWRNSAVSDGYEPGSTFKIVSAAIALEEGLVDTDSKLFTCKKTMKVADAKISCWSKTAHGSLTLREALEKSCNPSFIQVGRKIGVSTYYKYLNAFGLTGNTGASISGEASGKFHDQDDCSSVDLATMSFGQRFTITPLQLITTISGIVNDGKIMQPRIVYKTVNSDTGVTTNIDPVEIRQVVSEETSEKIRDMLKSVVTDGTGKYASVTGYSIGGKSGTSEPPQGKKEEGYIASFIAVAPIENPQVVCLVILKDPKGKSHQGGTIAAPVTSQILTEILPTLGITSTEETKDKQNLITLPDVSGKTFEEASKTLKKAGFTVLNKSENNDYTVVSQYPKAGISLIKNSIICLYDDASEVTSVKVPNLKGMSLSEAKAALKKKNLNIEIDGSGKVISQDIASGTKVEEGTIVTVTLRKSNGGGQ